MAKMRVHELAKELNIKSQDILDKLKSFFLLVAADPPHVSLIPCQCPVSHNSGGRCRLECPDCIQAFHTSVLLLLFIVTNILSEYLSPTLFDSISDFGIAFFHTLHSLPHWQLS